MLNHHIMCSKVTYCFKKNLVIKFMMPKMTNFANPHFQTFNFIRSCQHFVKVDQLRSISKILEHHVSSHYCELT